jgi:hypothetical protein
VTADRDGVAELTDPAVEALIAQFAALSFADERSSL